MNTREYTIKLLNLVNEGVIDPVKALEAALLYMGEEDVQDMCEQNEFVGLMDSEENYDDSDDYMDGDHESALASAGFGLDESYGYAETYECDYLGDDE